LAVLSFEEPCQRIPRRPAAAFSTVACAKVVYVIRGRCRVFICFASNALKHMPAQSNRETG